MRAVRHYERGDIRDEMQRPIDDAGHMNTLLLAHGTFKRTLTVEGAPVAVVGMQVRWPGVADVWMLVGDGARGHGLWLARTCEKLLQQAVDELMLHRVGAIVKSGAEENIRWAEAMGFELEGVERFAGPNGEDLLRYVRWTSPKLQS